MAFVPARLPCGVENAVGCLVVRPPVRTFRLISAGFVGIGLVFGVACSRGTRAPRPTASLASTTDAAAAFAPLRDEWHAGTVDRVRLEDFLRRFPDDETAPLAKVYLAFALISSRDLVRADSILATLDQLPQGSTRDLSLVAKARSLRLHGAPQSALEILRPFAGKIVDDADRQVYLEELALSAIAAHDDYEALAYLDAWLRSVGEADRDRVRARIVDLLDGFPRTVLEQTYRVMREGGANSGYGTDTQRLVAERLGRIAVETNDPALARWLTEVAGVSASELGGDAGLDLGELAASRRGLSIIAGKTVGLLLPTRSRALRDEAADVVRGVSWALDLPRSKGDSEGVRLVTRDSGEGEAGTRAAMEELIGEGAAVIIAGFDRASADRASAWSEQNDVPVLLLSAPSARFMPKVSAFVLGERVEREISMLADALVRHGVETAAFVADTVEDEAAGRAIEGKSGLSLLPPIRCDIPLATAGETRFPVASWIASGAKGWLVSGPSGCARDLVRDIRNVGAAKTSLGPRGEHRVLALTLEASVPPAEAPPGIVLISASAGLVPVSATRAEDASDPEIRSFMDKFGVRPTYWTAIGRDAGALAKAATAPLPADTTNDPNAVSQRRSIAAAGLFGARIRLWTTDDKGIGADRMLPRALRLMTWTPPK